MGQLLEYVLELPAEVWVLAGLDIHAVPLSADIRVG